MKVVLNFIIVNNLLLETKSFYGESKYTSCYKKTQMQKLV